MGHNDHSKGSRASRSSSGGNFHGSSNHAALLIGSHAIPRRESGASGGIGDGGDGVECGLKGLCLGRRAVEVEHEACRLQSQSNDAVEILDQDPSWTLLCRSGSNPSHQNRDNSHGGYASREVVGLGGAIKQKVVEINFIGANVDEGDHRGTSDQGTVLAAEAAGEARAWCSWCQRLVPAKSDDVSMAQFGR